VVSRYVFGARRRLRLLALGFGAAGVFALMPAAASAQEVVEPQQDGAYPMDSYFSGPCAPEGALPPPQEDAFHSTTYTETFFDYQDENIFFGNRRIYPTDDRTKDPQADPQVHDGPCEALHGTTINGMPVEGHMGNPFAPGTWRMRVVRNTHGYGCCSEEGYWGESGVDPPPEVIHEAVFKVYNPCRYTVKSVKGVAVVHRVGTSKSIPLKEGSEIGDGDELEVRDHGKLVLEGGDGVEISVKPGRYSLGNRRACRQIGRPLPKAPPSPQIEDGSILERTKSEFDAIIKAGKDLWNDGFLSRLRGQRSTGRGEIAFKVTRSERRELTTSCALKGGLRVYTKNRDVPRNKRSVTLDQGECAVTRDGEAPKLRR
jgi:hypothetical protein